MFGNRLFNHFKDSDTIALFIGDFSCFTWIYPMKQKSDVFPHFCNFQVLVENLFNCKIKMFQSDGGLELDNLPMKTHFLKYSSYFQKSFPDTQ